MLTQSELAQTGSVVLTAMDDLRPIRAFRAHFRVRLRGEECGETGADGHCGAEGLSFVFGPMPSSPFGELGVGVGLRPRADPTQPSHQSPSEPSLARPNLLSDSSARCFPCLALSHTMSAAQLAH